MLKERQETSKTNSFGQSMKHQILQIYILFIQKVVSNGTTKRFLSINEDERL